MQFGYLSRADFTDLHVPERRKNVIVQRPPERQRGSRLAIDIDVKPHVALRKLGNRQSLNRRLRRRPPVPVAVVPDRGGAPGFLIGRHCYGVLHSRI